MSALHYLQSDALLSVLMVAVGAALGLRALRAHGARTVAARSRRAITMARRQMRNNRGEEVV